MTNDTVSKAGAFPSNPTLSLPSSSFLRPSDQSDTCKVKRSEIFHNSKGDITE
ncbi:MAG TPA: hypothetical protein VKA91_06165 [Nitrososphaeraceae archaeon]|nr:hypothetical protein [Nitrososphaeraceae archaeon]